MKTLYEVISDAGHAWIKVSREELQRLGIEDRITPYSYQRGQWCYLEEDVDAATFMVAKFEANQPVKFRVRNSEYSRVRRYNGFASSGQKET